MTITYTSFTPFWTFEGDNSSIDLMEGLLPKMVHGEQEGHISEEGFKLGGLRDHFELFGRLYVERNSPYADEARKFLGNTFRRKGFFNCSTTINRGSTPENYVIQHRDLDGSQEKLTANLSGRWTFLRDIAPESCLALTGKSPDEAAELLCYINGAPYPPIVKRISEEDKCPEGWGIRMNANCSRFSLRLNGDLKMPTYALGLRLRKSKQRGL